MSTALSGLAGSIRAAADNETFDLAGKSAATIERAIKDAFEKPFPLAETIRLTFVTGAGKLARQKYDEQAAKAVTGPLKYLDYEDDAGGGAGTYKLQHDTGKNLKTVVVYPKVEGSSGDVAGADMHSLSLGESLVPEGTPEHKIAFASDDVFAKMMSSMCPSWSQKKGCMSAIENLNTTIQGLDQKLMTGTPLSDSEQDFYDSVSAKSLANKMSKVKDLMHSHVENGQLTASEKAFLLQQVSDRIEHLQGEIEEAEEAKKAKRVENLTKNLEKAQERKDMLSKITPKRPAPLKNERQIADLRKELAPLLQMEAAAKGRLLSPKEATALARKEQIEADIAELEESSRGWFESDEDFDARVQASRSATKPAAAPKKAAAKPAASSGRGTAWVTPGGGTSAWGAPKRTGPKSATAKAKSGKSPGGVFAAMMADSDSD
mmetsp:Transcript_11354/g.21669  ORF Transcript_11354/g.21669 Transcript_11354/m.21669 type:complete len:434 (+) Transcript_11354:48-1349(+)